MTAGADNRCLMTAGRPRRRSRMLIVALAATALVAGCSTAVDGTAAVNPAGLISAQSSSGIQTAATLSTIDSGSISPSVTEPTESDSGDVSTSSPQATTGPTTAPLTTAPLTTAPLTTAPPATTTPATTTPTTKTPTTKATTTTRTSWSIGTIPLKPKYTEDKFGNIVAQVGRAYGYGSGNRSSAVVFVVDSIQLDRGCDEPAPKSINGHFLVVTLRVELTNFSATQLTDNGVSFTSEAWTIFDNKGVAETGTSDLADDNPCEATAESSIPFTADLKANGVTKGKIAFDVSATKGTAVLAFSGVDGGWVYSWG